MIRKKVVSLWHKSGIPKTGELVEFNASSVEADFPEMGFPILDIDEAVVKP